MSVKHMAFTMYPVSDMPRAVAFYRDALGLKETDVKSAYWAEFDVDGSTFGIGNFEQVGKPGSAQSLALEVDDLPAFRHGADRQRHRGERTARVAKLLALDRARPRRQRHLAAPVQAALGTEPRRRGSYDVLRFCENRGYAVTRGYNARKALAPA